MIGTILLLIGITTGLIGLIDIFASNEQKESWSDTVLRLWNWLDEAKQSSYVDLIRRPGLQLWSAVIVTVLIVSTMWLGVTDFRLEGFDRSAVLFLLSSVFAAVAAIWLLRFSLRARTGPVIVVRVVLSYIVLCLVMVMAFAGLARVLFPYDANDPIGNVLTAMFFASSIIDIAVILALISVAPVLLIFLLERALHILEFFVRRVAESSKGVLMAISTVLTGMRAILKAWT